MKLDGVVDALRGVADAGGLQRLLAIGQIVVDGLYRGDAERVRRDRRACLHSSYAPQFGRPKLSASAERFRTRHGAHAAFGLPCASLQRPISASGGATGRR